MKKYTHFAKVEVAATVFIYKFFFALERESERQSEVYIPLFFIIQYCKRIGKNISPVVAAQCNLMKRYTHSLLVRIKHFVFFFLFLAKKR